MLDEWRRRRLVIELWLFFVGAPVLATIAVHRLKLPLFLLLPPILGLVLIHLLRDPTFDIRSELRTGISRATMQSIVGVFVLAGGIVAASVAQAIPTAFFAVPAWSQRIWLSVLLLYPLMSVLAQELVYRTFYFHRYGPLFTGRPWLAIAVNGALFGYAHLMFFNPIAILGTALSGTLFAWRYQHTRSFWAVVLEHTLYGWLIFAIGLGVYFFTGVANPRL